MNRREFVAGLGALTFLVSVGINPKTYPAKFMVRIEDDYADSFGACIQIGEGDDMWRTLVLFPMQTKTDRLIEKAKKALAESAARHFECSPNQIIIREVA